MLQELSRALNNIQLNPNVTISGESVHDELEKFHTFLLSYPIRNTDLTIQLNQFNGYWVPMETRIKSFSQNTRKANRATIKKIRQEVERIKKFLDENELLKSDDDEQTNRTKAKETSENVAGFPNPNAMQLDEKTETSEQLRALLYGEFDEAEMNKAIALLPKNEETIEMDIDQVISEVGDKNLQEIKQTEIFGEFHNNLQRIENSTPNQTGTTSESQSDLVVENKESGKSTENKIEKETQQPLTDEERKLNAYPKVAGAPNQQIQMSPQQYAEILQQHIATQEHELAQNKAAMVNLMNAPNPPIVNQRVPTDYSYVELLAHNTIMGELSKVVDVPPNPKAENLGQLRENLTAIMNSARDKRISYLVIQPFILDRFMHALDEHSIEILNQKLVYERLNLASLRDFLASRQEALLQSWARRGRSHGAESHTAQPIRPTGTIPKLKQVVKDIDQRDRDANQMDSHPGRGPKGIKFKFTGSNVNNSKKRNFY